MNYELNENGVAYLMCDRATLDVFFNIEDSEGGVCINISPLKDEKNYPYTLIRNVIQEQEAIFIVKYLLGNNHGKILRATKLNESSFLFKKHIPESRGIKFQETDLIIFDTEKTPKWDMVGLMSSRKKGYGQELKTKQPIKKERRGVFQEIEGLFRGQRREEIANPIELNNIPLVRHRRGDDINPIVEYDPYRGFNELELVDGLLEHRIKPVEVGHNPLKYRVGYDPIQDEVAPF